MNKILFTLIPEKGHINPYIGVAQHLQNLGFDVAFYSPLDISTQLKKAGFTQFIGEFVTLNCHHNKGSQFAQNVSDQKWLRQWIKSLLIDSVPDTIQSMKQAVARFQPDIIISDPMLYATPIVAKQANLPWVTISNSLNPVLNTDINSELLETVKWLAPYRQELFQQFELDITNSGCDLLSPYLSIAFTDKRLVGIPHFNVKLVGPSLPTSHRGDEEDFPWHLLDKSKKCIYMSLGSQIYHQPEMFKKVFSALKNKNIQLIATVNELIDSPLLGEIPSNIILSHYTPQLQLLEKVDVMITHGGAKSVMEAIHFAVPMLISPICNDQFHQAYFINKTNIGIELDLNNCTLEQLEKALDRLINSNKIRESMQHISESYQVDGALNAANYIIEFLQEREDR